MYTNDSTLDEVLLIPQYKRYRVIFIAFMVGLIGLSFYPYTHTETYLVFVENPHLFTLKMPLSKIEEVEKKTLWITKKQYAYQIQKVEFQEREEVFILHIQTKKKIKQNVVQVTLKNKPTTIGKELGKMVKKGWK